VSLQQWWYRVSGQQQRDEIAAVRSMANRYSDAALSLMPEILRLVEQVGIERSAAWATIDGTFQCTPTRWDSLTGHQWRTLGTHNYWGQSGNELHHAQDHAAHAHDFAEAAVSYADRALSMITRLDCQSHNLRYATDCAKSACDMAMAAHRHMLQGQAAYAQYERLRAAELAPSPLDLPAPVAVQPAPVAVPVEQPILVADWPMPQRKEAQP
jgi:hypothetical protein